MRALPTTIPELVGENARRLGDAEAIVDDHVRWSFADLDAEVMRVARAVIALGIQPGDRVAIWAINSARWIAAMLGSQAAGATVVPISSRFKGREAAYVLKKSAAQLLFCDAEIVGRDPIALLRAADADLHDLPTVALTDADAGGATTSWPGFLAAGEAVACEVVDARLQAIGPEDLAHVIFTSGTTGQPKGAMVSHRAMLLTARQLSSRFEIDAHDRTFVVLPFFHVFGLAMHLLGAVAGSTCVVSAVFDPEALVRFVERERITVVPGPPTIFEGLLAAPSRGEIDLSSLRLAFVTSTGVQGALVRRLLDEGLFKHVAGGYGLTEGIVVSLSRIGEDIGRAADWSGQVLPEVEVRVVDASGSDCEPDEPGEFVVRTPTMMHGYLDDPQSTAAAFDADGWLHTGDVGIIDDDGYVLVTDRKKDMFIVGGFNAYPAEIERILGEHPAVRQAAVIGIPDERLGEVGAAFIVQEPGSQATPDEIIAWSRENMANYKVPRYVELVDALPMTPSLKVAKYELRERLAERVGVS